MRAIGHYLRVRFALLPVLDALVLVQSMVLGFRIRLDDVGFGEASLHGVAFAALMLLVMTAMGLYERHDDPFRLVVQRIFSAYLVVLAIGAVIFYLFPDATVGRGVFALASTFGLLGLLLVRYAAHRATMLQMPTTRVLVLGDGPEADEVANLLRIRQRGRAVRLAALIRVGGNGNGNVDGIDFQEGSLLTIVEQRRISEIVVALRERRGGQKPLNELLACKIRGVRILDLASFFEREAGLIRIEHLRASWLIYGTGFDQGLVRAVVKRTFDLMASTVLLVLAAPVMAITALAVRLDSKGPVLFMQERVRDGGAVFLMLKFRSMKQDAEKDGTPRWASTGDERLTRVGRVIRRLRIDELPQLINVIKGDMSFVGPRPERPYFVSQLAKNIPFFDLRHNVKPGITGWAQVRFEYGASVEDALRKLEYDLFYVKNHSLFLDLMILFETVRVVLLRQGAR